MTRFIPGHHCHLVVFFEFITDEMQSSETPALVMMLWSIGKILVTPTFRNFVENKNEKTIQWLTHTLVCQFQSILNRFVELANNYYTYQRLVDTGGSLLPTILDGPYKMLERILNIIWTMCLNNSSNTLFGIQPLSYMDRHNK